jgi:flagellar biosynthesis protein FlhF
MKIKRIFAPDMRTAIRQIRETLGPDAVILSNKTVEGGVELMAALDFDDVLFTDSAPPGVPKRYSGEAQVTPFPNRKEETGDISAAAEVEPASPELPVPSRSRVEWTQDPLLLEMRKEMQVLRHMVENELSGFTWKELGENRPQLRELLRRLLALDIHPALCQRLAGQVGEFAGIDEGWRKALYFLSSKLKILGDQLLEEGGVVAVIGPTGVGKTTSIAKLAARFALRHGNRHLALISVDSYRIGAQEQLTTYARILDVPMRSASNAQELDIALNAFADKRLILIDTAGMSQRDLRISEQLALLSAGNRKVRTFLALSATTQLAALRQAIQAFGAAQPEACILTKLDEAASLGNVLSAIIDSELPLAYVTDGQRVPEDLHLARAHTLVSRAAVLGQQEDPSYSEEYLALTLGDARASAHG